MDTGNAFRIENNLRQFGRQGSSSGDGRQNRAHKIHVLFTALEAGDLEHARHAFAALLNFDVAFSQDPDLAKIGAALKSNNLYSAQHFMREYKTKLVNAQSLHPFKTPVQLSSKPAATIFTNTLSALAPRV
jgi:hypothetical protein